MKVNALKGVQDILPAEMIAWNYVHKKADEIFSVYGYKQIIVPIIEESRLFTRSIGQETDIVEKEMYTFLDRGNRSIALRPEATASIVRAYLEHNFNQQQSLVKFFYSGAMFRGEKPQSGRNRQFYQIGVEALGSSSPYLDAEIIHLAAQYLRSIHINNFNILINSVGTSEDKLNFSKKLRSFLKEKRNKLCKNCQKRYSSNLLRVLDCKEKNCNTIMQTAPVFADSLSAESLREFSLLKEILKDLGVDYTTSSNLVRGLDYYTKTVFEITHDKLGAQNTILAGGRYDNLVEELGGPPTGAAGFACGVERLLMAQAAESFIVAPTICPSIYAIALGEEAYKRMFTIIHDLRRSNLPVYIDFQPRSLKAQLRQANKLNCSHVLILGEAELNSGMIILKDMQDGKQESISLDSVKDEVKKKIGFENSLF